jgi:hypothetical protein
MVHGRQRQIGPPDRQALFLEQCKRLRCSDLVDQVQVYIEYGRCVGCFSGDNVIRPDLLE